MMAYNKSVTCAVRGCPHEFEASVSRFQDDVEKARCPTCYNTTRMVFSNGSLDHTEVV